MYYSTIGVIAVLVLIIVNWDILRGFQVLYDKAAWNVYRGFLFAVLTYYITDILWGILESHKLATLLFTDTTIYFVAMALGISFWAEYTVAYLEDKSLFGRFLVYAGRLLAILIAILVIVNIFVPVLFTVDKSCVYHELPVRNAMLVCQIMLLLVIAVYALTSMIRSRGTAENSTRFKILASFGIIMALCLFIQLWFPYLPIYSIGYMLGTCMLHSFVASDEKEELRRGQEETKKITELKERFSALLDNMPGMAFTKDAKTGVYLTCNQAFAEYANKENSEEVVGLTDNQIFDAETAAHFVEDDRIALSLSTPYIFYEDVSDAAGNQRQLQTTKLKYTDTAGRMCVLGMCLDVTDMVRIQHEQAMTKEAYESAVNSGLMYTSIAQTLARDYIDMYYVNTDTEEYIEYCKGEDSNTLSEVRRGWHFFSDCKLELSEMVYDEDREAFLQAMNRKTLMKVLDGLDSFAMTYREKTENGPVYVNMKISRMDDRQYIIMGITNVDSEMRETIAKNEALTKALNSAEEANKARTTFISGMSHEIRTPINAIIGLDTLAQKNDNLDNDTRKYLEKIEESAHDLLALMNDLLDMNRIESGQLQLNNAEFSFKTMMDQVNAVVQSRCNNKGLNYDYKILNQINDTYFGDDMKLKEMLLDTLSNAVHFTETQESISITVEKIAEFDDQSTLRFCIKNAGTGMNEDYISELFEVSTHEDTGSILKHGSKGLSMAITRKYAELMNGSVQVQSSKGVGTEFIITVVLKNCRHDSSKSVDIIDLDALNVLVVDNNPIEVEHAKMVLEEAGIGADTCTSGQEALDKMKVQHAKHKHYHVVLMDWNMPEMNGRDTSAEIEKLYAEESIVVALTANSWDDIQEEAHSVGVYNYLAKPLFADSIQDDIVKIIQRSNLDIFKEKKQVKLAGRRILLAEDVEVNAEIMTDLLEIENIKVDHASNGKEAVELFEKSTAGIYAAILMDVRMPQMDGLAATEMIRAMDREDAKRIPIIALTANSFDEDVQVSLQAGMNAHLTKPVDADKLIKVLGELIYEAEN